MPRIAHRVLARTFLCLFLLALTLPTRATAQDWWSTQRGYRVSVEVGGGGFARTDKVAEVPVDFTTLLAAAGLAGAVDLNSLLLVETDGNGVIDGNVPFQFDPAASFNAATQASGTLVLLMTGATAGTNTRTYHLYFDLLGKSFVPPAFQDLAIVSTVTDEGQSSFRVQTANATYFYQKEAGGFSSLVDSNGNDWLNYHPTPTNSPSSTYRGLPNMVHPEGKLHPGATGHTTTLVHSGPLKETLRTVIDTDGDSSHQWDVVWEFFPHYARMTVNDSEHDFWFLYEGTPGGDLVQNEDYLVRSNGLANFASDAWVGDLAGEEWVYIADPGLQRSIFLINHAEDSQFDSYRAMSDANDDMTVFGFGRKGNTAYLQQIPAQFTIGLMDTTAYADAASTVRSAYKPLITAIGGLELMPSGNDNSPPILSDVHSAATPSDALVTWNTNEPADSTVDYGLTTAYGVRISTADLVNSHSLPLLNLMPGTLYHYRVSSTDGSGNTGVSTDRTFTTPTPAGSPSGMVSDNFSTGKLDATVWEVFDPQGDSTIEVNGAGQLAIAVPAGKRHDLWKNRLSAPRVRQAANDTDFQIEVKFDSAIGAAKQLQGIVIEQDGTNLLRFDFNSNGKKNKVYAASIANGIATSRIQKTILDMIPLYLRVIRVGDQWTESYSYDGSNWIDAGTFSHSLNVTSVGLFAGNAGSPPPPHTGLVDYFMVDGLPAP